MHRQKLFSIHLDSQDDLPEAYREPQARVKECFTSDFDRREMTSE